MTPLQHQLQKIPRLPRLSTPKGGTVRLTFTALFNTFSATTCIHNPPNSSVFTLHMLQAGGNGDSGQIRCVILKTFKSGLETRTDYLVVCAALHISRLCVSLFVRLCILSGNQCGCVRWGHVRQIS